MTKRFDLHQYQVYWLKRWGALGLLVGIIDSIQSAENLKIDNVWLLLCVVVGWSAFVSVLFGYFGCVLQGDEPLQGDALQRRNKVNKSLYAWILWSIAPATVVLYLMQHANHEPLLLELWSNVIFFAILGIAGLWGYIKTIPVGNHYH